MHLHVQGLQGAQALQERDLRVLRVNEEDQMDEATRGKCTCSCSVCTGPDLFAHCHVRAAGCGK